MQEVFVMNQPIRTIVGKSEKRIDAVEKATGKLKYISDYAVPGMLHAKLVTSTHAHATIKSIDTSEAWNVPGVRAIVTGEVFPFQIGPILADRPPLAFGKVRYFGEPVAIVVADSEHQGKLAASKVKVEYEPLAVVNSVQHAFQADAPLVHENSRDYTKIIDNVYPVPGTNIGSHIKIRKGDIGADNLPSTS
jgi:CO/xanthine dehydrogenase Mo-binding subunit